MPPRREERTAKSFVPSCIGMVSSRRSRPVATCCASLSLAVEARAHATVHVTATASMRGERSSRDR